MLALFCASLWGGEVYRSVDAAGNVSYSDRPQGSNVEKIYVAVPRAAARTPVRSSATSPVAQAGTAPEPQAEPQPSEPTASERAEERAQNCSIARERLERYMASRRLYRSLPDGEREYLTDAEIDEARAKAAADVETWCA